MSWWTIIRGHYLLRVAVGYLALVWLLVLAVAIIFPLLELPQGSVRLSISLLIVGLPLVLVMAWAFRASSAIDDRGELAESASKPAVVRRERAIIVALVVAVCVLGARELLVDDPSKEPASRLVDAGETADATGNSAPGNRSQVIHIGIISPKEGSPLAPTGIAHESSIMLAFDRLGTIRAGNTEVNIQFVAWNDEGDPERSGELAVKLAEEQQVAAILGPVNSSSTARALVALRARNIHVPVMSSLSTARDLIVSGQRDPNFFRLIFNDADRMAALARYIEKEKRGQGEQRYLFLYENDEYGKGLVEDLQSSFYSSNFETSTWCELLDSGCTGDECNDNAFCPNGRLNPKEYDAISRGDVVRSPIKRRLGQHEFDDVVLLGTVPGSLAFARGLARFDDRLDFFFVGSNKQLFDEAPLGSVTIGNPVLDPSRAPTAELTAQWNEILALFSDKYGRDPSDFVVTAYEAAIVLHSALRTVLQDSSDVPSVPVLREKLLNTLDTQRFDAVEPWRRIDFIDGRLTEPHTAPIYRIGRGRVRDDPKESRSWVEIHVEQRFGFLEGPIRAELEAHAVDRAHVVLSRISGSKSTVLQARDVVFSANKATVDFHVFRPGQYRVSIEGMDHTPSLAQTRLVIMPTYVVSMATALLGALLIVGRERAGWRARLWRVLLGMFAGFTLTFSALYGTQVAGWIPFPKFGDEPFVNAIITGFIGGIAGPYVLAEALLSWALTLSFGNTGTRTSKEIPEGL